jgi:hypothetical protein
VKGWVLPQARDWVLVWVPGLARGQ